MLNLPALTKVRVSASKHTSKILNLLYHACIIKNQILDCKSKLH